MKGKYRYGALLKAAGIVLAATGVLCFLFCFFILVTGKWKPDRSNEYVAMYRVFENISYIVPPAVGIIATAFQLLAAYVGIKYAANMEIASGSVILAVLAIGAWVSYIFISIITGAKFVVTSLPVPIILGIGCSAAYLVIAQRMKRYLAPAASSVSDMWRERK